MENSTASALSSEAVTALSVVSAVASLLGSVGNLLVLLAVFKNETIRTIPDFFITSLAFSDFTVCAVFLPLSIYQFYQQNTGQRKDSSSLAKSFLGHVSMVASATNMFAVTIDRVIAIGFPFKYVASVTKQKAAVTIAVVWMISIALGALLIGELISIYVIAIYSAVLLLNTIVMYIYIFVKAKRQENRIQEMTTRIPGVSAEKKVAKTIFTVVGIYAVCWLPTLLLPAFVNPSSEQFQQSFPWVMTLLAGNSALNPFIYCLKSQKYRLAFSKILRRTSVT
ncbi:Adenosine receptor A2a [Acropora cervicornis]|uniref:Adenosine receptor A2a n=1 Tax=Acropora cervicornis TaxID=6130 RepID=A0AAD9Q686_ACRCE|nr:Adenosine receptor A2a [Acropora cervicornis]